MIVVSFRQILRFTTSDTLRPDQRNMSNVSSLSSSIANLPTNTPAKRGRKKKSDVEKADYKKRHTTYNKKRNFQLPITETQKSIHWEIEVRNSAYKSQHFAYKTRYSLRSSFSQRGLGQKISMSQNGIIFCIWGFLGTLITNITVRTRADHLLRLYSAVAEPPRPVGSKMFV